MMMAKAALGMLMLGALPRLGACAWLSLTLLGASSCALLTPKFARPNVSVVSIAMQGGNLLQQTFLVKLNIQNPNDRALPVNGVHAELQVAGERVAGGVTNHAFVVPALGETEFELTVTANIALGVLKLATRIDSQADAIDYELTGSASLDLAFMRDLPFHQTGRFSLRASQ